MVSNGQILAEVKSIKKEVELLNSMLQHLVSGLRADNRDMLTRLLAKNMAEYSMVAQGSGNEVIYPTLDARLLAREDDFSREHLAGTVVEE